MKPVANSIHAPQIGQSYRVVDYADTATPSIVWEHFCIMKLNQCRDRSCTYRDTCTGLIAHGNTTTCCVLNDGKRREWRLLK